MRRVAFAVVGLVMIGAGPALAQYYPPRPVMPVGPLPSEAVPAIVRAMGLDPVGPPALNGHVYVQRAADYYGKPLRVIVDARRAQVVSVEPLGAPGSIYGGPYAATAPYGRRPYPAYGAMPPADDDDEFDYQPQRPRIAPQALPPRPAAKSATVTPARPPAPRKRPAAAPQEAAGSVEPVQAAPQNAAPAAPANPAAPTMPPVVPLN